MAKETGIIGYDPAAALLDGGKVTAASLTGISEDLESAHEQVLNDVRDFERGEYSGGKDPLDAGFVELPAKLLADYETNRSTSELGKILLTAERLRDEVDRVVVLGIGGSYMGARALMQACCDPFHNEQSRGQRGSRPRLYFQGNNLDNDATQALLSQLSTDGPAEGVDERWALVVISKSGGTLETAVALRLFLDALRKSCGKEAERVSKLVIPVTGSKGKLFDLSGALGCKEVYRVPKGVGGRFSILSPVGLLPAALLGLDVVALLRGAVAMNEHFRSTPVAENEVLKYAGVGHLWNTAGKSPIRVLSVWADRLESVGLWYDQLLAESLGKEERGPTPLTALNTRDLHSRAQQHQEGCRDKLINNLICQPRHSDDLSLKVSKHDQDDLNKLAGTTLPTMMSAAIKGTNQAYRKVGRPTADLLLPSTGEFELGQLFQMLMLATVVEGELLQVNPYGQEGVEAYKENMGQILGIK